MRRNARLNDRQRAAWAAVGGNFIIDVPRNGPSMSVDPEFTLDIAEAFERTAPLTVEIGGGGGEAIIDAAQSNPETNYLAIEVWEPGIAKTLMGVRRAGLTNVRIVIVNAAEAVSTMLPDACTDELWTFFPDPWPKKRHHKRRLVTDSMASSAERVLRPGGVWRLATDWGEYAEQIRQVLLSADGFEFSGDFCPRYPGRVMTRFEQKGIDVGRPVYDIAAQRKGSLA